MEGSNNSYLPSDELDLKMSLARHSYEEAIKKQLCMLFICICYLLLEFLGALFSHSLAIMSDVIHLFADCIGLLISILSLWLGKSSQYPHLTYGYHRSELIGGFTSVIIIYGFASWLILEAIGRIKTPIVLSSSIMLVASFIGLTCTIIQAKLTHGHYLSTSDFNNIHKYTLSKGKSNIRSASCKSDLTCKLFISTIKLQFC